MAMFARCKLLVLAAFCLSMLLTAGPSFANCSSALEIQKIPYNQIITYWYFPIELGFHDKIIRRQKGRRTIIAFAPAGSDAIETNIRLMPGAEDDASSYYMKSSIVNGTPQTTYELYSMKDRHRLSAVVDRLFDLTWRTYQRKQIVPEVEIDGFKKTEDEMDPRRKVIFMATAKDGRPLAILRLYDGSPYPTSFLGEFSTQHEAPDTDPRIPVERRYPHIDFREESPFVFEPGRLASTGELEDVLHFSFYHTGGYLLNKFGFLMAAPKLYVHKGRVYIEITERYLEDYMKNPDAGGMGFHLFAMARRKQKMKKVRGAPTYASLKLTPKDKNSKFILYMNVHEFINRFHTPLETRLITR
jgi:hypothetical protein